MLTPNARSLLHLLPLLLLPPPAGAQFKYFSMVDDEGLPTFAFAPRTLSATGLYGEGVAGLKGMPLIPQAIRFDVNSPLWSDAAHKLRWILLKAGTSVVYDDTTDYYAYPDSAVFIKQFSLDTVPGDSTSRVPWETRILVNQKRIVDSATMTLADKWYGFSYKWKRDGTDAVLVDMEGERDTLATYPQGRGEAVWKKKWRFPGQKDCWRCHVQGYDPDKDLHARSVLGFFTAQLNRPYYHSSGRRPPGNQLDTLFARNVFRSGPGGRPAAWNLSPRWWGPADPFSGDGRDSLGARARAYIAANCSGCHSPRGIRFNAPGHVIFNYNFHNPAHLDFEFRNQYVTRAGIIPSYWPDQIDNEASVKLVVPGHPEWSLLLARQLVRNTLPADSLDAFDFLSNDQMPPLATFEVNRAADSVLREWVRRMPPLPPIDVDGIRDRRPGAHLAPALRGNRLVLPPGWAGAGVRVVMYGLRGRVFPLQRTGEGEYALPAGLPPGVYLFQAGGRGFARSLL